jgi:hypothetical protein
MRSLIQRERSGRLAKLAMLDAVGISVYKYTR